MIFFGRPPLPTTPFLILIHLSVAQWSNLGEIVQKIKIYLKFLYEPKFNMHSKAIWNHIYWFLGIWNNPINFWQFEPVLPHEFNENLSYLVTYSLCAPWCSSNSTLCRFWGPIFIQKRQFWVRFSLIKKFLDALHAVSDYKKRSYKKQHWNFVKI